MLGSLLQDLNPWWSEPRTRRAQRYPVRRQLQARALAQVLNLDDRRALVIEGQRQVGKTVLLLQVADDLLAQGWPPGNLTYFDFSDDRIVGELSAREIVKAKPANADPNRPRVFLFDEVGRATNWAAWLKQTVDRNQYRLLVTDSASSLLRAGSRESGQGRWDLVRMEGLTFAEFVQLNSPTHAAHEAVRAFPGLFERYLARGGYPEHALADSVAEVRERIRADIVDRAIRRDLQTRYDDPRVKDLFLYLVQHSGGVFDARKRAQDLGADYRSVDAWNDALQDTLLIADLPAHALSRSARSRLRARPKIYASDHGLIAAFSDLPAPLQDSTTRGRAYEAMVFRHLRDYARTQHHQLGYLEGNGRENEVDFVLDTGANRIALEVTSSQSVADKPGRLHEAGKRLKTARLVLVYGGIISEQRAGIHVLPATRFALDPIQALAEVGS